MPTLNAGNESLGLLYDFRITGYKEKTPCLVLVLILKLKLDV
jgi:hypothetical protein